MRLCKKPIYERTLVLPDYDHDRNFCAHKNRCRINIHAELAGLRLFEANTGAFHASFSANRENFWQDNVPSGKMVRRTRPTLTGVDGFNVRHWSSLIAQKYLLLRQQKTSFVYTFAQPQRKKKGLRAFAQSRLTAGLGILGYRYLN